MYIYIYICLYLVGFNNTQNVVSFLVSTAFLFSRSGQAWSERFFPVFHSVYSPFPSRGSSGPWTRLRTPKFFNLSGSILARENRTKTFWFGDIWALNVPGQVWPSMARAPSDRFFVRVPFRCFFHFRTKWSEHCSPQKIIIINGNVKNGKRSPLRP